MTVRLFLKRCMMVMLLCGISPVAAAEGKTVRILTIGNSFSRNATRYLGDLAREGGRTLIHQPLIIGGASFQVHADKAKRTDKAREYAKGMGLVEYLKAEKWDYVTIQQASIKSHDYATYQPHAAWLRDMIVKHAPSASLLIHQTWAYRADDPRFTKPNDKPGEPKTQEAMYRGMTASYDRLAMDLGGTIIPVGDAFFRADTDTTWGFREAGPVDPKVFKHPALPVQTHSLHVGWTWRKSKDGKTHSFSIDGHHANMAGEYLGACVWYEMLFGQSAVGSRFIPKGLDAEHARFLQQAAHESVQARAKQKQDAAAKLRATQGLVAFWDFQEPGGSLRTSGDYKLQEMKGPVARVDGGVFGRYAARIKRGQWLMIEREQLGKLNIHGKEAAVTVAAWVYREDRDHWQAIAGVWDETRKKRQYCLFLNAPRGTRADEMKRYPLGNRIHGHVSAIGGPSPGDDFCITYSSGGSQIPMRSWQLLVMRYDSKESRVYVNGKLDALEQYNPFPYPDGLFDGGEDGSPFTVGAVHRGGSWGNFFGGRIGGLAVFDRALSDEEIAALPFASFDESAPSGR